MIYVSHKLPVNVPGEPTLDRAAVWDGLVLKANNALPFVPSMTFCEVTDRHSDSCFDRDIEFRGQQFHLLYEGVRLVAIDRAPECRHAAFP